jgi:hypothetical protein
MEGVSNEEGAWGGAPRWGGSSKGRGWIGVIGERGSGVCTQGAQRAEGGNEGCN